MYSDRQAWANSENLDQTSQNAASDQSLHCLLLTQQFYKQSQEHLLRQVGLFPLADVQMGTNSVSVL